MPNLINAKTLRQKLAQILRRASKGERFTVIYRSKVLCEIGPTGSPAATLGELEEDPLYRLRGVGTSKDGKSGADHDELLYGKRPL